MEFVETYCSTAWWDGILSFYGLYFRQAGRSISANPRQKAFMSFFDVWCGEETNKFKPQVINHKCILENLVKALLLSEKQKAISLERDTSMRSGILLM